MPTSPPSGKTLAVAALGAVVVGGAVALSTMIAAPTDGGGPPTSLAPVQHGPGDRGAVYRAEQAVEVWHAGKWYRGRVHAVGNDGYFVTFDGFSKSWHEWVDASRLRRAHD